MKKRTIYLLPLLSALFISPMVYAGDAWDSTLKDKIKAGEESQRAYEERMNEIRWKEREKRYEEIESYGWPLDIEMLVKARQIKIGMTKDQVVLSWGVPGRKHKSVFEFGVREQWIYGDRFHLFFDNDKLNSWHEIQ